MNFNYPIFNVYKFVVNYSIEEKMILPKYNKGNIIRGAFGETLRRLVCTEYKPKCSLCRNIKDCVYTSIFSPIVPDDSIYLRKNIDIPRGFIINSPLEIRTDYEAGEFINFDLIVIGKMINYLPYIILVLNEIGKNGIGRLRSKMSLDSILQVNPFNGEKKSIIENNIIKPCGISFNIKQIDKDIPVELTLKFITPTRIIKGKEVQRIPEFSSFIKRLRDRYFALNLFYSDDYKPDDFDHILFGKLSEKVMVKKLELKFIEQYRNARSQNYRRQDISGFIGKVVYEGDISYYYPLIVMGQYIGVGKGTTFGLGKYEIVE